MTSEFFYEVIDDPIVSRPLFEGTLFFDCPCVLLQDGCHLDIEVEVVSQQLVEFTSCPLSFQCKQMLQLFLKSVQRQQVSVESKVDPVQPHLVAEC